VCCTECKGRDCNARKCAGLWRIAVQHVRKRKGRPEAA
jgi:hypothetical protein